MQVEGETEEHFRLLEAQLDQDKLVHLQVLLQALLQLAQDKHVHLEVLLQLVS
jgi:hypothetical protein